MVTSNSWQRILATVSPAASGDKTLAQTSRGLSEAVAKRLLDLGMATLGLVALLPLLLLISIAVKLDSRGPVLYVSRRLGRNGHVFHSLKFRTMTREGQETCLGTWLRRHGLDELPQLVNVIRGEMSVVGPRPLLASDRQMEASGYLRRLNMMPGITGLWAVPEGQYSPWMPYVSPDDAYRRNWSVWLDMVIVARSVGAAVVGR
jgi:lipopolysaccharide/colanic/teichoic acid biosynthesis glycosyltransferase